MEMTKLLGDWRLLYLFDTLNFLTLSRTNFETNFVDGSDGADAPIRERAGPREVVRMS